MSATHLSSMLIHGRILNVTDRVIANDNGMCIASSGTQSHSECVALPLSAVAATILHHWFMTSRLSDSGTLPTHLL